MDALIIIPGSLQISNLYEILVQAVNRYLSLFEDNLREYIGFKHNDTKNLKFQTFHFYPAECGCFITLLYLENKPEALLSKDVEGLSTHINAKCLFYLYSNAH